MCVLVAGMEQVSEPAGEDERGSAVLLARVESPVIDAERVAAAEVRWRESLRGLGLTMGMVSVGITTCGWAGYPEGSPEGSPVWGGTGWSPANAVR